MTPDAEVEVEASSSESSLPPREVVVKVGTVMVLSERGQRMVSRQAARHRARERAQMFKGSRQCRHGSLEVIAVRLVV